MSGASAMRPAAWRSLVGPARIVTSLLLAPAASALAISGSTNQASASGVDVTQRSTQRVVDWATVHSRSCPGVSKSSATRACVS